MKIPVPVSLASFVLGSPVSGSCCRRDGHDQLTSKSDLASARRQAAGRCGITIVRTVC
jgi:hypothetical protein